MQIFQTSLKQPVSLRGIGVHSGAPAELILRPAPAGHGIVFSRRSADGRQAFIPAQSAYSLPADLCTVLAEKKQGAAAGVLRAEMVEHLMAALAGMGVDNAAAELSAAEMPILDGSAARYVQAFAQAGLEQLAAKRRYLRVKKPIRVETGSGGYAEFLPLAAGKAPEQRFHVVIDFAAAAIGRQELDFALSPAYFAENLASASTFGFLKDAERLRSQGLARGAGLDNSVVLDENGAVINPEKLIAPDGFVRHKVLDAVGDTALLGAPFIGLFRSYLSGHKLNGAAVNALLADKSAYEMTELD